MKVTPYMAEKVLSNFYWAYVSLHSSNPVVDDAFSSELNGGGYARIGGDFQMVGATSVANMRALMFSNLPPVVVTHIGIWDSAASGELLASIELDSAQRMRESSQLIIDSGDLVISL